MKKNRFAIRWANRYGQAVRRANKKLNTRLGDTDVLGWMTYARHEYRDLTSAKVREGRRLDELERYGQRPVSELQLPVSP
jgi:hypothetical protein